MKLIENLTKANHLELIKKLISDSDETYIAVAFLKQSGLQVLLPNIKKAVKSNKVIKIIAGKHFGITEPSALWELFYLFEDSNHCQLNIAKAVNDEVFHPKFYMFRKGQVVNLIIGSSNITLGGLQNNCECSLQNICTTKDLLWKDAEKYFNHLMKNESEKATRLEILKYEKFHKEQRKIQKTAKSYPKNRKIEMEFTYENLHKYFILYNDKERALKYKNRVDNYLEARKILNKIATDKNLGKKRFSLLLDELVGGNPEHYSYWHSGGLSRGKRGRNGSAGVYDHWHEFQVLVNFVRKNIDKNEIFLFDKGREYINLVKGAKVNYLTEILMTYDRNRFAVMNKRPLTALNKFGLNFKINTSSFSGEEYVKYCALLNEISIELGLKDMLEIDSFLNFIYTKTKNNLK